MIERLLSYHGLELWLTVGQTLLVTVIFQFASAALLSRSSLTSDLPAELEGLFARIRRKWADRAVSRDG